MKLVGLNPHPFGYAFSNHDAGQVSIGARDRGHDRGIGNSEAREAMHTPVLVNDGIWVSSRTHARGPDGMNVMHHTTLDEGVRPLVSLDESL